MINVRREMDTNPGVGFSIQSGVNSTLDNRRTNLTQNCQLAHEPPMAHAREDGLSGNAFLVGRIREACYIERANMRDYTIHQFIIK